jgi:hypothetical protein
VYTSFTSILEVAESVLLVVTTLMVVSAPSTGVQNRIKTSKILIERHPEFAKA